MQIDIPSTAANLIQQRAELAGFGSPEEYVCELILKDLASVATGDCQNARYFEKLVVEGLHAGPMTPFLDEEKDAIRAAVVG